MGGYFDEPSTTGVFEVWQTHGNETLAHTDTGNRRKTREHRETQSTSAWLCGRPSCSNTVSRQSHVTFRWDSLFLNSLQGAVIYLLFIQLKTRFIAHYAV